MTKLTEHFTLEELTHSATLDALIKENPGWRGVNDPAPWVVHNLERLADVLETIRLEYDGPLRISSGFRSPILNSKVRGSTKSRHCMGLAADIVFDNFQKALWFMILALSKEQTHECYLSSYGNGFWVHYSIKADASEVTWAGIDASGRVKKVKVPLNDRLWGW